MSFLACVGGKPHVFVNGATRHYYKRHYYKRHYYKRHYYKTIPEVTQPFVQPTLTANGTMGGNSFAVSSSNNDTPYKAFDASTSSYANALNGNTWLAWYNPKPLYVTSVQWKSSAKGYMQRAGRIEYSDDYSVWTNAITWNNSNSTNPFTVNVGESYGKHRYWRIYFTQKGTSSGNSDVANVSITATEFIQEAYETEVAEGEEYDRYEDVEVSEVESYSYYEDEEVSDSDQYSYYENVEVTETDEYSFFEDVEVSENENYDVQADILNTFGVEIK